MTSPIRSMALPTPHRHGVVATVPARTRTSPARVGADTYCFGRYRLLVRERLLLKDNEPVRVGSRAFDLLLVLVERAGQTVARQELFERVWPDVIVAKVNLRVHIAGLRKVLSDGRDGNRFIVSVAGRGYGFVAPVRRLDFAAEAAALSRHMFGRDPVAATLSSLLSHSRFISLGGAGNGGHASVAFAIAHALATDFDNAVCFVDLAGIDDPAHVTVAVAAALGYEVEPQQSQLCLLSYLKDKKLLLVFDNCERVLAGIAQLTEQLFNEAPRVQVLISSQKAPSI
jgi:DNA-binding winged helix-turn-helix (wHTH) protein